MRSEPGTRYSGTSGRDRHGRGMRGPLALRPVPRERTRAERFDDLVLDAIDDLDERWGEALSRVQLAVEDVPPAAWRDDLDPVPLGRIDEEEGTLRLVVHRWPIELRAADDEELAALVHEVVVEQVAELLGLDPATVDPEYGIDEED